MEYTIEKFKVKDGFPVVTYTQFVKEVSSRHEASFNSIVHGDLQKALDRLTVHMCLLTELVDERSLIDLGHLAMALNGDAIYERSEFSSFRCSGFSLSSEGVVLIGRKTLSSKKVLNLVTPFALLNEDSDYTYSGFLNAEIQNVLGEVELMLEGKFGGQQLELFEQEEAA